MREDYFIINGNCSLDYGIVVKELPNISIPKKRSEEVSVLGRNGALNISDNTYELTTKTCKVYYNGENPSELINFLQDGEVIFSNLLDRYYNAKIVSEIPINYLFKNSEYGSWYEFNITFRCQPFGYSIYNEEIVITKKDSIIYNSTTYYSEPIITIYGDGDINLLINEQQVTLKDINENNKKERKKKRNYTNFFGNCTNLRQ
ncbi:hypothetical protein [uncultured Clostridium sp.]|uniref:hypothetical protein n=1 Tax=uncultured Clostridium sp. TaxID=59620 RepID=UPI00261BFEEE|nr:hypothetical protein [uncultured Clostridium sp.]